MRILFFLLAFKCYGQLLTEQDKQLHFGGGAMIGSITYSYTYLKTNDKSKAFAYSLLASAVVGTTKELIDDRFDKKDILATMLGSVAVNTILTIIIDDKGIKILGR